MSGENVFPLNTDGGFDRTYPISIPLVTAIKINENRRQSSLDSFSVLVYFMFTFDFFYKSALILSLKFNTISFSASGKRSTLSTTNIRVIKTNLPLVPRHLTIHPSTE